MKRLGLGHMLAVATLSLTLSLPALAQDKPGSDKAAPKQDTKKDDKAAKKDTKDSGVGNGAEVGKSAPDFELKGTDGKTYKLSSLKDKVVVLEWINRECPVCVKQMPEMKKTAEALAPKGVVWLAIDSSHMHGIKDNAEHVTKEKLPYAILDDAAGTVGKTYGAKSTPTMFVINKGTVAYSGALVPNDGGTTNYVLEAVEQVLANKEVATKTTKAYGCSVKYKKTTE